MEGRIRAGRRQDRDLIWRATTETVWADLPEDERSSMGREAFEAHFRKHASRIMDSRENAIFVAEDGVGAVMGYAIVGRGTSMLSPRPYGFVYDLWVAPAARRRGVARALADRAREWCRENGLSKLKLEVGAGNSGARAFYAAIGFQEERVSLGIRV